MCQNLLFKAVTYSRFDDQDSSFFFSPSVVLALSLSLPPDVAIACSWLLYTSTLLQQSRLDVAVAWSLNYKRRLRTRVRFVAALGLTLRETSVGRANP